MAELMKGHSWSDRFLKGKLRFEFPVVVEVKSDEIRAHFKLVTCKDSDKPICVEVLSYAGKPLHNLGWLCERMFSFFMARNLTELDCGVRVNTNFNDSYRYVRSSKGLPDDLKNAKVEVLLFDNPTSTAPYSERRIMLRALADNAERYGIPMFRPCAVIAHDEAGVLAFFTDCREAGEEGVMVKTLDHKYEKGKRTYTWLKLKPEETYDGRITKINRAVALDGTPHDRAGSVTVEVDLPDGQSATADPAGLDHGLAADMFRNPDKYIGQWIEFKCMERDRQGGFRHPIFERFREAKS